MLNKTQEQWIHFLKTNQDKQMINHLGFVDEEGQIKQCCCLGALLLLHKPNSYNTVSGQIVDTDGNNSSYMLLRHSYSQLHLHDASGSFTENKLQYTVNGNTIEYDSLLEANDQGVPWNVIASFVEQHPQSTFTQ